MSAKGQGTLVRTPERHRASYDVRKIRKDFPLLDQRVYGKPLVYLDNAATAQKPASVIEVLDRYYREENANIHRGVYRLSVEATKAVEEARSRVRSLLNAADSREIVFVRGATEGINLVANSFVRPHLKEGDEVVITGIEHHSNIVPWQIVCQERGAKLRPAPIDDRGEVIFDEYLKLLTRRTKFVSIVHISNALGTVNPVKKMVEAAHVHHIPVLVDGAQSMPHLPVDLRDLGCEFFVFSGHKLYGPTGIGALYGRADLLEAMPPYQGGGEMIKSVRFEKTIYNDIPYKFEAGTPHIAGIVGLGAAIEYVTGIGLDRIAEYERGLLVDATAALRAVKGLRIVGEAREKAGVISFLLDDIHPHDIGTIADREGVAIRTGHHCAQPVMERFGIAATARASFAMYNTREEVGILIRALEKVREVFHA